MPQKTIHVEKYKVIIMKTMMGMTMTMRKTMMVMATLRTSRPVLATAVVARATRIKR